MYRSALVGV